MYCLCPYMFLVFLKIRDDLISPLLITHKLKMQTLFRDKVTKRKWHTMCITTASVNYFINLLFFGSFFPWVTLTSENDLVTSCFWWCRFLGTSVSICAVTLLSICCRSSWWCLKSLFLADLAEMPSDLISSSLLLKLSGREKGVQLGQGADDLLSSYSCLEYFTFFFSKAKMI